MSASETSTSTQPVSPRGWPTPKHMSPGYFALVMGTGIVTIGADQRGWHTAADILLIVTGLEYAVLVLLALWRLGAYRHDVVVDLTNPAPPSSSSPSPRRPTSWPPRSRPTST